MIKVKIPEIIKNNKFVFSASSLETLENCGLRFYYSRIAKIPDQQNIFGLFGTAFHNCVENFYIEGKNDPKHRFDKRRLIGSWPSFFNAALSGVSLNTPQSLTDNIKQSGYPLLQRFHQKEQEDGYLKPAISLEQEFRFPFANVNDIDFEIYGKIDRIIESENPNKYEVEITDYKTTKKMPMNSEELLNTIQLPLYSLAYRFLHKNDKKKFPIKAHYISMFYVKHSKKIEAYVKKEHRIRLRERINKIIDKFIKGKFEAERSEKACYFCPYTNICPAYGSKIFDLKNRKEEEFNLGDIREWEKDGQKMKIQDFQIEDAKQMFRIKSVLNANQVGTGKTLESITLTEAVNFKKKKDENREARALLISPKTILKQWKSEIYNWTGKKNKSIIIDGDAKERQKDYHKKLFTIVNYEKVISDIKAIKDKKWDLIFVDEAQRIKGDGKTARLIRDLNAEYKIPLSGTPIGKRLDNLFRIMAFCKPLLLGPWSQFRQDHFVYDSIGQLIKFKNLDKVREKLGDHFIRRKKSDVWKNLPPVSIIPVEIEMSKRQKALYNEKIEELMEMVNEGLSNEDSTVKFIDSKAGGKYVKIRRMLDYTHLIDNGKFDSPKHDELLEKIEDVLNEDEKILVFSQYRTVIEEMGKDLENKFGNILYITGDDKKAGRDRDETKRLFNESKKHNICLCTDSAQVGLNLQGCSNLVNFDLPLDPMVLAQRVGRIDRPGQKNNMMVWNFYMKGTVEENIQVRRIQTAKLSSIVVDEDLSETEIDISKNPEYDFKTMKEILI